MAKYNFYVGDKQFENAYIDWRERLARAESDVLNAHGTVDFLSIKNENIFANADLALTVWIDDFEQIAPVFRHTDNVDSREITKALVKVIDTSFGSDISDKLVPYIGQFIIIR